MDHRINRIDSRGHPIVNVSFLLALVFSLMYRRLERSKNWESCVKDPGMEVSGSKTERLPPTTNLLKVTIKAYDQVDSVRLYYPMYQNSNTG